MAGPNDKHLITRIVNGDDGIVMYVPGDDGITRAPRPKPDWQMTDSATYMRAGETVSVPLAGFGGTIRRMKGIVVGHDESGAEIVEFVEVA